MKKSNIKFIISVLLFISAFTGCSSGGDSSGRTNKYVACRLDSFNQCFEWINLTDPMVSSLSSTCVNDDNGVIVESYPTVNLIGICEELNDPNTPDLLNFFYLSPTAIDPVAYALIKEQACTDAGGNWTPVN